MKRTPLLRGTTLLARSTPMKRSAMKRGTTRMKSRGPKMTPIRKSAKDEDCTLRLPGVCQNRTDTVVWCHENSYAAGKGMALKARDECGAYGCALCHEIYDGQVTRPAWLTEEEVDSCFEIGKKLSLIVLKRKGLLPVKP